jgi:hypothetical protein
MQKATCGVDTSGFFSFISWQILRRKYGWGRSLIVVFIVASVVPPAINLPNIQQLKLPRLLHGSGWQELESLLDFGRLGVEEGGGGSELRGRLLPGFVKARKIGSLHL